MVKEKAMTDDFYKRMKEIDKKHHGIYFIEPDRDFIHIPDPRYS